jgi:hypothetical protein
VLGFAEPQFSTGKEAIMHTLPFWTVVVLTIGVVPSAAEPRSRAPHGNEGVELAKLREIFASVDNLPAKDARWVEVQAGPSEHKTWHKGWLLRESETEIQLLTEHGWKQTFDKKKLAAGKPPIEFTWSDAWAVRNADFAKHCRDFLVEKKKEVKDDPNEIGVYRFQRERAVADAAVVDSARLARREAPCICAGTKKSSLTATNC